MTKVYLLLLTVLFVACNGQSQKTGLDSQSKDPIEVFKEREQITIEKQYDNLGEQISSIEFGVRTDNKEDFEDGIIPWASLESPESDIPNLIGKDEVVSRKLQSQLSLTIR